MGTFGSVCVATAVAYCLNVIGLDGEVRSIIAVVMVIDTITGVTAAWIDPDRSVLSRKMIRGVVTKVLMFLLVAAFAMSGYAMSRDVAVLIDTIASVLIISEIYSITGNIYNIKTGKSIPEDKAMERVMEFVIKFLESKATLVGKQKSGSTIKGQYENQEA